MYVNGKPVGALLDSGPLCDFISTTVEDQLKLKLEPLDFPLPLQLAVSGSRCKVNHKATVSFKYLEIDEKQTFYIMNINSYDMILGTLFMYQHQLDIGFNLSCVLIRSNECLPINAEQFVRLESRATQVAESYINQLREGTHRVRDGNLQDCESNTSATVLWPI